MAEKGLCMMGDLCPYDHGVNPVILEDVNAPLKQEEYQVDLSLTYPPPRMMRNRPMFGMFEYKESLYCHKFCPNVNKFDFNLSKVRAR